MVATAFFSGHGVNLPTEIERSCSVHARRRAAEELEKDASFQAARNFSQPLARNSQAGQEPQP